MARKKITEYVLSSPSGYRKFYVTADTKEQAIERFRIASELGQTNGFALKDVPVIYPNVPIKSYPDLWALARNTK